MRRYVSALGVMVLLFSLMALPTGCGPSAKDQQIGELQKKNTELESKVDATEKDKQRWQMLTIVGASVAVVLLFVGAGLGSSARRKARERDEQ